MSEYQPHHRRLLDMLQGWARYLALCTETPSDALTSDGTYLNEIARLEKLYQTVGSLDEMSDGQLVTFMQKQIVPLLLNGPSDELIPLNIDPKPGIMVRPWSKEHPRRHIAYAALDCGHCGGDAIESASGLFIDGDGTACKMCNYPGHVSADGESNAYWVESEDPGAKCNDPECHDCVEPYVQKTF